LPEQTDASSTIEGERKTVTALFADIKGSIESIEDLDHEQATISSTRGLTHDGSDDDGGQP
jgi:hypothetical protein